MKSAKKPRLNPEELQELWRWMEARRVLGSYKAKAAQLGIGHQSLRRLMCKLRAKYQNAPDRSMTANGAYEKP